MPRSTLDKPATGRAGTIDRHIAARCELAPREARETRRLVMLGLTGADTETLWAALADTAPTDRDRRRLAAAARTIAADLVLDAADLLRRLGRRGLR